MEPISLISNNAYQIPWIIVQYYAYFMKDIPVDECRDQEVRAQRLCKLLPNYDICVLQEIWGSQTHTVSQCLQNYHKPDRLDDFVWNGIYDWGADYWNLAKSFMRQNGGLYFASKPDLPIVWYHHHTFEYNVGETMANKSLGLTLLNMKNRWGPDKYLLVLNVHYNSPQPFGDTDVRNVQRLETRDVLRSLQDNLYPIGFRWNNCGVVFVGDFNVSHRYSDGNVTSEYTKLVNFFTPPNLPMRNLREEMGKAGYQELHTFSVLNTYIPEKIWDECSTIDYIFALDHLPTSDGFVKTMRLKATKVEILQQLPHRECSDHYPLTAIIIPDTN